MFTYNNNAERLKNTQQPAAAAAAAENQPTC
jgi:hypothetical protein